MGSDLNITKHLQDYILKHGLKLHPVQKEIINHNLKLGDIKRMQISISQCQFLHLIIKVSKIKKVLEIGTFTGLSTLSMALALPDNGEIIALDKNRETNKIAVNFFKKAEPFPHLVIDNFLDEKDAKIISDVFPSDYSINWNKHGSGANADKKNFRGIKLQCSDENEFPEEIKRLMNEFNSQGFLYFLQKLVNRYFM